MNKDELDKLNPNERALVLNILKEYSSNGTSSTYQNLLLEDYREIPVTVEEFINNKNYLGGGLIDTEGKQTVFPY